MLLNTPLSSFIINSFSVGGLQCADGSSRVYGEDSLSKNIAEYNLSCEGKPPSDNWRRAVANQRRVKEQLPSASIEKIEGYLAGADH